MLWWVLASGMAFCVASSGHGAPLRWGLEMKSDAITHVVVAKEIQTWLRFCFVFVFLRWHAILKASQKSYLGKSARSCEKKGALQPEWPKPCCSFPLPSTNYTPHSPFFSLLITTLPYLHTELVRSVKQRILPPLLFKLTLKTTTWNNTSATSVK